MTNLIKGVAIVAPATILIFAASWFLNREATTEMRQQEAAVDRDFAYMQAQMSPGRDARNHYMQQTAAAQSRYSSATIDFQRQKQNIDNRDRQINAGIDESDNEISKKLNERGN
ncbi:hypothetical protein [Trichlorobacter lovleyi]|uniref:hypothetical protein n=1 Tax=Trichlorobacter lovleyi TaxID=313985 RepID=UPI002FDE1365